MEEPPSSDSLEYSLGTLKFACAQPASYIQIIWKKKKKDRWTDSEQACAHLLPQHWGSRGRRITADHHISGLLEGSGSTLVEGSAYFLSKLGRSCSGPKMAIHCVREGTEAVGILLVVF